MGYIGGMVYKVDPYMHYHAPQTGEYFYELYNQRSQNNGIIRYFDYDTMLIGTSMGSGFRTTELDKLFGCKSIKVTFSGALYKEIDENIRTALSVDPDLKTVIRSLDLSYCMQDHNEDRTDLGDYPSYLYDNNPFNDVRYLFNRYIVFDRVYRMVEHIGEMFSEPGITSFDEYPAYMEGVSLGVNALYPDGIKVSGPKVFKHLTEQEKDNIRVNAESYIISTAMEYPDVDFYCFYPPYSMGYWAEQYNNGDIYKWLEAEEYLTSLIVPYDNIHLFSFWTREDIITDLNNYKDPTHYASWINSLIIKWMNEGKHQLTESNYKSVLDQEKRIITQFDYESLNRQEDYEADYYAAALLNNELTGAEAIEMHKSSFALDLDEGYRYIYLKGTDLSGDDPIEIEILDESGNFLANFVVEQNDTGTETNEYIVDLSGIKGIVTIIVSRKGDEDLDSLVSGLDTIVCY